MRSILFFVFLLPLLLVSQKISEDIEIFNDTIALPGTLTYLEGYDSLPLVVFIHGSGNADRNGNQGGLATADHIKQLSDSLVAHGIAFFRFDKRTSNPKNRSTINTLSFFDLVKDVETIAAHFGEDRRFSGVHLIGHSQGSLIGMLVSQRTTIKSYTSLAGPGTPIDQSLVRQITVQNDDLGKLAEQHVSELMTTDTIVEVHPFLYAVFAPQNQGFLREWIPLDPAKEIAKIKAPVLILNGDADSQITVADAQLLQQARPDARYEIIPKMNHVLKTVNDALENQQSYLNPDFRIPERLISVLTLFIKSNE
ncbi:MAG: alpha/beta hydrolase [Flavobacteriaceae bacterium]|nr:alpha/beta hydrolase [Flavobacteriaceae bacterium]